MILRPSLLLAAAATAALAQNSDLGLMIGVSHVVSGFAGAPAISSSISAGSQVTTVNSVTGGSVSAGGQINYAIQLSGNPHLYFELPVHITGSSTGVVSGGTAIGESGAIFFITPGIRWNFRPAARVSIYAAAGVGAVIAAISEGIAGNGVSSGSSRVHSTLAFDYGVGLDFRLTRLVSLRTEVRQALMVGEIQGRHHDDFFTAGVGLHF
jgi:opacity protein-like surface antigen